MSTCVCVLSNSGERLMPTFRLGKVRRLLKDGKAKIVKHHPFTIQLLYDSKTNTQPIEICEDVGYNYIGISVKSESHEYVSAQYDTLQDEKEHHDDCRKYRRTRRNRLRYRKPRFDNRKRSEGWLAPSLEHKKQLNIRLVERYVSVIPITHATVEVGSFDTMLLQAIQKGESKPEGADYQKGPRYNLATLREAVFYRDNYTCQVCGRKIADGAILHMHHMFYWKGRHGNSLDELLTVCEKCHTPANHQKSGKLYGFGEDVKFANLSGAAFMNTVRWQIVNELYAAFGKPFVTFTYGAMTKLFILKKAIIMMHMQWEIIIRHTVASLDITKNDAETIVCWKNSMMPLISTPAPVTKQKVKNFLTAELAVITKRILKTCTSTAAKRCRRGVAL